MSYKIIQRFIRSFTMGEQAILPKLYFLSLMTLSYIVGELTHFLINTTSRAVAREIEYGEMSCFRNESFPVSDVAEEVIVNCTDIKNETDCGLTDVCHWTYNGLGIQYQVILYRVFRGYRVFVGGHYKECIP